MNNNCDYQRAYDYVRDYQKNHPNQGCCSPRSITGPTGPTGPQGPATIAVGTTRGSCGFLQQKRRTYGPR